MSKVRVFFFLVYVVLHALQTIAQRSVEDQLLCSFGK